MKYTLPLVMGLILIGLSSCVDDPDAPPPATPSTTQITAGMGFDSPLYNDLADRHNPCQWFDGYQNDAEQVTIETFTMNAQGQLVKLYDPQIFLDGRDFYGGNPNGLHFKAPETGGFIMVVTVYGKPNADCCPGPPPGRPVYRMTWPWFEINKGFPVVRNICQFTGICLYF